MNPVSLLSPGGLSPVTPNPSVLFVCVHNAGKSQMAAALMRHLAGDRIDVHSAGTQPDAEVHDLSAQAVAELGADMSGQTPTALDPALMLAVDRVVVLGAEAQVEPVPGMRAPLTRWLIDDPAEREIQGLERVRLMRDDIAARVGPSRKNSQLAPPEPRNQSRRGSRFSGGTDVTVPCASHTEASVL